eukprot:m.4803 g.4803  ORF g.4803 m.4803 type:complete len:69 (-) comp3107_c0_seq1:2329-2535(-)
MDPYLSQTKEDFQEITDHVDRSPAVPNDPYRRHRAQCGNVFGTAETSAGYQVPLMRGVSLIILKPIHC